MEVLGTAATLRTGLARRAAARPHRAHAPVLPDPDLRRRHQRDPARHHRHGRARPAPGQPVREGEIPWISRRPKPPRTSAAWSAPSPNRCAHPNISVNSTALDAPLRPRPVDQADRRRHPVHRGPGIVGRRRIRRARAGCGAGGAGPPARRGALPGIGRAGRWRAGEVRLRGAAAGVGGAGGQRREDPHRRAGRRDGRGAGPGQAGGDGVPADRDPHAGRLRPGRRRVPGSRRNRFGHQGFRRRRR